MIKLIFMSQHAITMLMFIIVKLYIIILLLDKLCIFHPHEGVQILICGNTHGK